MTKRHAVLKDNPDGQRGVLHVYDDWKILSDVYIGGLLLSAVNENENPEALSEENEKP